MQKNVILIIDDDQHMVNSIKSSLMLEGNDYDIISASNVKEGLEIYHREEPVLVLLDLHLPATGCVNILEEINQSDSGSSSVIVLTENDDDECIRECMDLGVNSFIRRPFNTYEFITLVKHVLSFRNMQHALQEQCKSHISAHQCLNDKPQGSQQSSQKSITDEKNISAAIIGIECPLHFTSY